MHRTRELKRKGKYALFYVIQNMYKTFVPHRNTITYLYNNKECENCEKTNVLVLVVPDENYCCCWWIRLRF